MIDTGLIEAGSGVNYSGRRRYRADNEFVWSKGFWIRWCRV